MFVLDNHNALIKKLTLFAAVLFIFLCTTTNLSAEIRLTPRLSAGVEYTDNVRLVPDNTESDYITTVTPGITLEISGRPAGLTLDYAPSYVDYAEGTYEDYWGHAVNLDGWWRPDCHHESRPAAA